MDKATREKFLARWIPYGMKLLARAEAHGIEWQNMPLEKLEAAVICAEEFATPDEYKGVHNIQNVR